MSKTQNACECLRLGLTLFGYHMSDTRKDVFVTNANSKDPDASRDI